ncbi:hypothetical protein K502DRAFT_348278 [Neoconidiobolus thromboides FSU 785]|nr:hypothetical protein K502DRAFT_348278 [Neoconidiobolus thromboides FSU 785]
MKVKLHPRIKIEHDKLILLLNEYNKNTHPSYLHLKALSQRLNINLKSVRIWFQNRRALNKRKESEDKMRELDFKKKQKEIIEDEKKRLEAARMLVYFKFHTILNKII